MRTMPDKKPKPKDRPENPAARELAEAMFRAAERKIKLPKPRLSN